MAGSTFRNAIPIGLAAGGVVGFYLGIQQKVGEGYECGPIAGVGHMFWTVLILGAGILVLIVAGTAAATRHKRLAITFLSALGGLVIGVTIGYALGTPVDRCERPTDTSQPAVLTLRIDAPLNVAIAGGGVCTRDTDVGPVRTVGFSDDGVAGRWEGGGYRVVDLGMGYGSAEPGLTIGLFEEAAGDHLLYRQTADAQVVMTAAADHKSGSINFSQLPRHADSDVSEAQQISGVVQWKCPSSAIPSIRTEPRSSGLSGSPTASAGSPTATMTPEPRVVPDTFSIVWREEPECSMHDVAPVIGPLASSQFFAAGTCTTADGTQMAMAWQSTDGGFGWRRVLAPESGTEAFGIADDGRGSMVVVGMHQDDFIPLVWRQDRAGAFSLGELPDADVPGEALAVARGPDTMLIVGTTFPDGTIEGRTRGAAWLMRMGEQSWTMVETPRSAINFADVTNDAILGNGDRYTIAGFTAAGESALWTFTVDGEWERLELAGAEDEVHDLIDSQAAVGTHSLWTYQGDEWLAAPLGDDVEAWTGVRLFDGEQEVGFYLAGKRTPQRGGGMFVLHSRDGQTFVELPHQPDYQRAWVHALSFLGDRVIGVGYAVYMGPMPEAGF